MSKRDRLKAEGKCIDCGLPRGGSYSLSRCLTCLEKRREYHQKVRGLAPNLHFRKFVVKHD